MPVAFDLARASVYAALRLEEDTRLRQSLHPSAHRTPRPHPHRIRRHPHHVPLDNHFLDAHSNGLVYVAERLKKTDGTGTVFFTRGERSRLAELAATML